MGTETETDAKSINMKRLRFALISIVAIWAVVPFLITIWWAVIAIIMSGFGGMKQDFWLTIHTNANVGGPTFWVWFTFCAFLSIGVAINLWSRDSGKSRGPYTRRNPYTRRYQQEQWSTTPGKALSATTAVLVMIGLFMSISLAWNADKNVSRYYASATTFYAPNIANPPASLAALFKGASKPSSGHCALTGAADVPSCVKQATLPQAGFYPRVSSLAGAKVVMQRTSGSSQNVDLLENTLTYLNGNGKNGTWSGVRDGSGAFQPTEGVVEWTGTGNPTECYFGGRDKLSVAINGTKMNSLTNRMHNAYPELYWQDSDIWGYCNAAHRPVLVFPVAKQVHNLSAVVSAPAGVITVGGSSSGAPTMHYASHAANMPGPVYPETIAAQQRTASNWAAGRANEDRGLFGFEPSNSQANASNASEYLLKSKADGHDYWVTPLTLVNSKSQLFIAYAVTRADTVNAGHLNSFAVYTLANNDIRTVNIDNLDTSAKQYVGIQEPSFFSQGGKLIEYTPTNGDVWRAFGELNGRVVFRLDISSTNQVVPSLVQLDNFNGTGNSTAPSDGSTGSTNGVASQPSSQLAYCGQDPVSLTHTQQVACAKLYFGYIAR